MVEERERGKNGFVTPIDKIDNQNYLKTSLNEVNFDGRRNNMVILYRIQFVTNKSFIAYLF